MHYNQKHTATGHRVCGVAIPGDVQEASGSSTGQCFRDLGVSVIVLGA